MKLRLHWTACAAALVAAALLGGCGGGSDSARDTVTSVKVVGDSLADSGTFGIKFTVQGTAATGTGSTAIWPDHVASLYGKTLCAHYVATGAGFAPQSSCTNYAVAGGAINYFQGPVAPQSIPQQLKDLGAAGYAPGDLLLVDGGGNDAADLISAYLAAAQDGGQAYASLLGTVLDAATVSTLLAGGATGMAQAGGAYMQALATQFVATIKAQALDKGATRVALLNMPAVTLTPKVRVVLQAIAATNGAEAANQLEALFDGWVKAFNAKLAELVAGEKRVALVDFYSSFVDQVAHPAQYAYTNVTTPACPATGVDGNGLPTYNFPTCTAAALSAMTPPEGASGGADWWKTYMFSDSFHPTPHAHQLMGEMVARALTQAGWR